MSFLNQLNAIDQRILATYLQPVQFPKNACIVQEGDQGDGCYLIDEGEVRLELQSVQTDTNGVLAYLGPGTVLGEFSFLDGRPRSASAYAHDDVSTRWLSTPAFEKLCAEHPQIGLAITKSLGQQLTAKLREQNDRVAGYLFVDEADSHTNEMVARAVAAQREFETWSEKRVDALLQEVAETIAEYAGMLAEATVAETGMGIMADKVTKIKFGSLDVYQALVGQPAAGRLNTDAERRITEFASPVGVVLGLIPLTNPVSTLVFKSLICLKGRNALILSCHHKALRVGNQAGEIIQAVLRRHHAPVDLVQWIRERTSRRKTMMFMKHRDVSFILATGGPSIVKAAYSSGTPAIGVGAGNAPVWICADANVSAAAKMIIQSKSFDNGVICGSENNLVVDASIRQPFMEALETEGAIIISPDETNRFTAQLFDPENGRLRPEWVGKSAHFIAQAAGIQRHADFKLIVVPVTEDKVQGPYGQEKLAPFLSLFTVDGREQGLAFCKQILANQGYGHTAIIHTQSPELAQRFGLEIAASRLLVNSPGSQGCIGLGNGLTPSLTLGCGTFGGNSTTDNVNYTHLLNIKRLVLEL